MKVKRILRFYFAADSLERTLDRLIMKCACDYDGSGEDTAERIYAYISEKNALSRLWNYVDGIIKGLSEQERLSLKKYAFLRDGVTALPPDACRAIKRAAVKFTRRARRLDGFWDGFLIINDYYCILGRADYLSGRK